MSSKEQQILKIIKYIPSIFIIISSIIVTLFFYIENKKTFLIEKENIEKNYILENKAIAKDEVNRVYDFIQHLQKTTETELKESIKNRVYEAHTIATSIYNKYKDEKSKEEILDIIKTTLNDFRYNQGRGYFFIDNIKGEKVLQPPNKALEGKSLLDYKDAHGYQFMQSIVKTIADKTERYDQYYWENPNSKVNDSKKISFYKYFEPFNVAIGSGEYVEEFEKQIQKKALDFINLIHYGKSGYIFIINYDGVYLNHIRPEYIGKDASINNDTVDIKKVIETLIDISKNGEGYLSYTQNKKPNTDLPTHKISFVKGLNDWGWMIGTGFYEDEISETIKKREIELNEKFDTYMKNILILSSFLTFILLFISKYISNFFTNKFNEYKKELEKKQNILYQQSKMASMGEMIGNIAHQWRQPLSTITTASTGILLEKDIGILQDQTLKEYLHKINKSAQYLSKTIDDFRNFFNPEKVKNYFFLSNAFDTALELLSAQFNSQNIKIIKNIEDIEINSYENELIQGLINILNNARDELKDKELDNKLIFISTSKNENEVIIKIKDNAGGISKENINKIFEPYFTTKHKSQGTGIGLYMTEEIIVRHLKGEITVKNDEFTYENSSYIGAEFIIKIPLQ
ncbi:MAG: cache domain-containing protein [Aliarcobacter sp.]|nr:cache domain-containing protein [Aliarcobacter sp.]